MRTRSTVPALFLLAAGLLPCLSSCTTTRELPSAGTFQRSGSIALELATSKPTYRVGEVLAFTLRPSEDCYIAAWIIGADGVTTPLYPNTHDSGRIFRRGVTVALPGSGPFRFLVAPPEGREQLVVVASSEPVEMPSSPPSPGVWLKGARVETTASAPAPRRGEARVVYEVSDDRRADTPPVSPPAMRGSQHRGMKTPCDLALPHASTRSEIIQLSWSEVHSCHKSAPRSA